MATLENPLHREHLRKRVANTLAVTAAVVIPDYPAVAAVVTKAKPKSNKPEAKCLICEKIFKNGAGLAAHMRHMHKD